MKSLWIRIQLFKSCWNRIRIRDTFSPGFWFSLPFCVEKKKGNRSEEREKRREKYKLERQNGGLPKDDLRALQLDRLKQAAQNSIRVGIDLQFDDAMNEKVRSKYKSSNMGHFWLQFCLPNPALASICIHSFLNYLFRFYDIFLWVLTGTTLK